ncbi:hypothetical protein DL764_005651 [Monosporascus ibericus]|uniref:MARVEL domain-containing protein n=1 Tax=Monosporascus ibericus TaxID=155417 RepID=A0A4Q4T877_9PEZI|nr:hypothetical protein DL764_005651 [Monosporascus ibericus]
MQFRAPQLGALGVTFTAMRLMQFASLIAAIGLVANSIDEITSSQLAVPKVLVGTITVASLAVLYVMVSYILYYDSLLPLLIAVASDFAMLIAFIVVAATSGKNLNLLECSALAPPPDRSGQSQTVTFTSVSVPPASSESGNYYGNNSNGNNGIYSYARRQAPVLKPTVDYISFVAQDQPHCYEIKAVWGLSIALCVLFGFSSIVCAGLWRRIKGPAAAPAKDIEDGIRSFFSGPSAALGTRILSPTCLGPRFPPLPPPTTAPDSCISPAAPISAQTIPRRPVPAPAPPIPSVVVHSGRMSGPTTLVVGRSLTHTQDNRQPPRQPLAPAAAAAASAGTATMPPMPFSTPEPELRSVPPPAAPTIVPPAAVMPAMPTTITSASSSSADSSPTEVLVPIVHRPALPPPVLTPTTTTNTTAIRMPPMPPTPDSDDEGFTPVTPGPSPGPRSPRVRAFDALGLPVAAVVGRALARVRSRKVTVVDPSSSPGSEYEDVTPLTPAAGRSPLDGDLEAAGDGGGRRKTMRRTFFGIIEGWWDLGLLERGRSFKRRG